MFYYPKAEVIPQSNLGARGIFYVGGVQKKEAEREYMDGQMFVEVYVPKEIMHPYPITFFHGAGQVNVNWLTTPDGRKGWADYFVEQGYVVYLVEQPCRGRSCYHFSSDNPLVYHDLKDLKIRFASDKGKWPQAKLHNQWPGYGEDSEEMIFNSFVKSQVEYLPDNQLSQKLVLACMDEFFSVAGSMILLTHSQAGPFGWIIADSFPDFVKGIVALEPSGPPFSRNLSKPVSENYGITDLPLHFEPEIKGKEDFELELLKAPSEGLLDGWIMKNQVALPGFKNKPILLLTGEASYHAQFDYLTSAFLERAGVEHDFVPLAKVGIHGNGHMMMLEKNNLEIAEYIHNWIENKVNHAK